MKATKYGSYLPTGEPETSEPPLLPGYTFYTYPCPECPFRAKPRDTTQWAALALRKHMATAHGRMA